jgi:hypothetical protein
VVEVSHAAGLSKRAATGGWAALFGGGAAPRGGRAARGGGGGGAVECAPLATGDGVALYEQGGSQVLRPATT